MLLKDAPMGAKLRFTEGITHKCFNIEGMEFDYIIKSEREEADNGFQYSTYTESGEYQARCYNCLDHVEVEVIDSNRFKAGDIAKSPSGMFARIAAVVEGRYVRTYAGDSPEEAAVALPSVVQGDDLEGWKLYTGPEEVTLSMEEIADKFNIDVSKLRIKE